MAKRETDSSDTGSGASDTDAESDATGSIGAGAGAGTETGPTTRSSGNGTGKFYREPKSMREIVADLHRPKGRATSPRQRPAATTASDLDIASDSSSDSGDATPSSTSATATTPTPSTKEIINGLDVRELRYGAILLVVDLAVTIATYVVWHHSKTASYRRDAPDLLLFGLVGVALLALGAGFRRRALLGFAAFIVGLELLAFGLIYGVIYLFYGGWLITRSARKQRLANAASRGASGASSRSSASKGRSGSGSSRSGTTTTAAHPPSASKRYTPPRRTASSAKKR